MKLRNIVIYVIFFAGTLSLLDLKISPDKSIESRILYFFVLSLIALVNFLFFGWLNKKYPYKSSYKPKDQA